jgi:hypothetical protein
MHSWKERHLDFVALSFDFVASGLEIHARGLRASRHLP